MVSDRRKIERELEKKQREISNLENKLKTAKVYLAALEKVLKLLGNDDNATETSDSKLRSGSAVAQARDVILNRGDPVHIDDLLEAMGKEVTRDSKASLAGSIAAYVRKHEIFSRPAPSTFGLIELGHKDQEEEEDDEPPSGFGSEPVRPVDDGWGSASSALDEDVPF